MDTLTDLILWILQWFLGAWFVLSTLVALPLVLTRKLDVDQVPAFAALSQRLRSTMGLAHIVGGLGLLLPHLTGIQPWLTPLAALALAVQCFMAGGYHLRAREDILEPSLWGLLCGAVFVGRIDLFATAPALPGPTGVIVVVVMFLALVVNMVILLRGPQNPIRHRAGTSEHH